MLFYVKDKMFCCLLWGNIECDLLNKCKRLGIALLLLLNQQPGAPCLGVSLPFKGYRTQKSNF